MTTIAGAPPVTPTPATTPAVPPAAPPVTPPVRVGPPAPAGLKMKWDTPPAMSLQPGISYRASIATADGVLGVQLLAGAAPNAVNSFNFLAKEGFYKGSPVHRKIDDFMFQTGDPTGTGTGGPGYMLKDDPVPKGWNYFKGIVAMANAGPDTSGSQFFVMLGNEPLPPAYTIIGYVDEGRDVLDKINARKVEPAASGEPSKPVEPFWLEDVTISESPIVAPSPSDEKPAPDTKPGPDEQPAPGEKPEPTGEQPAPEGESKPDA